MLLSRRLNRSFGVKGWGDQGYAMEEVVAELARPSSRPISASLWSLARIMRATLPIG